jgi:hypothetical protein
MVWGGICASGKTPLVIVNEGVKINKEYYQSKILEAVYFHGLSSTSATSNGHSSRIVLQRTRRRQLRSGAEPTFQISSHLRNGHPSHIISIIQITAYGRFWRPGPVLRPTKFWSCWSNHCSENGIKCRRRRCGMRPKISRASKALYPCKGRPLRESLNILYT